MKLSPQAKARAKELVDQLKPTFQGDARTKDISFDDEQEVVVFTMANDKSYELDADKFLSLYAT